MFSAIYPATAAKSALLNSRRPGSRRSALTLVEMLIAISITLVMMGTVVGVFATVSSSVQKRRAVIESSIQLRHVRLVLQGDLDGATCPLLPWQKPESNHGYFEIIEGLHSDFYPSLLTDGSGGTTSNADPEIDHAASTVPSSNLPLQTGWVTDGGGLGDYDDILAFTTRNETEPFSGRAPDRNTLTGSNSQGFGNWQSEVIKSPVAEVVWYAVQNPVAEGDDLQFFGEPGFRTIYRRVLLVAPWTDYHYNVAGSGNKSRPGVLRILRDDVDTGDDDQALASLIAFQERYDISARIEFDPTIGNDGRWTIAANTLADLTKRENRYEHHGYVVDGGNSGRRFPFVMASAGGAAGSNSVQFVVDPELPQPTTQASSVAIKDPNEAVYAFDVNDSQPGAGYIVRPLAILGGGATARAMVNEAGQVVHVTTGLVPLGVTSFSTSRRGEDLMMSDVLGFDVQVFDPEAPVYALRENGAVLKGGDSDVDDANLDLTAVGPASIGWMAAARQLDAQETVTAITLNGPSRSAVVSFGAYVDLGYRDLHDAVRRRSTGSNFLAPVATPFAGLAHPKSKLRDARLTRVYDTWSFHYENNGIDEDGDRLLDEGTNGFDNPGWYDDNGNSRLDDGEYVIRLGVDDPGERETSPPYPSPLRAIQVKLRVYESDSRQIREVTVRQHFVPE